MCVLRLLRIPKRVCADHDLQRCVKYGLGTTGDCSNLDCCVYGSMSHAYLVAGKPNQNPASQAHIKKNKRMVQKTRQSQPVEDALDQVQITYDGLTEDNCLKTKKGNDTRWNGEYEMIQRCASAHHTAASIECNLNSDDERRWWLGTTGCHKISPLCLNLNNWRTS